MAAKSALPVDSSHWICPNFESGRVAAVGAML